MAGSDFISTTTTLIPAPHDDPRRATLTNLSAQATGAYGRKDYAKAAELYSEAVELQAELNGEMLPTNAELLYSYGRCLYKIGVSQSDVLGNKIAGDGSGNRKRKRESKETHGADGQKNVEAVDSTAKVTPLERQDLQENKPYFELQGDDADWDDSEGDDEIDDDNDETKIEEKTKAEDEDDDFATAYEVLDLARVLLHRKLDAQQSEGKGKSRTGERSPDVQQSLEKLADIHDLQAEISLENENFPLAVADSRSALAILEDLFPLHNRLVAEAHFKLSLALEFASVTQVKAEKGDQHEVAPVDENMRAEAASHTSKTIESCKLRKVLEEESLEMLTGDEVEEKKKQIKDVTEMLEEFEQRLLDLRAPAAPMVADPAAIFAGAFNDTGSASTREEKAATAQDISGLIKHKKKPLQEPPAATNQGGKRSAPNTPQARMEKRVRVENNVDSSQVLED